MIYSYYPGCTLKAKASELDVYARKSAEVLGFTMEEIPEWQCCGAVYPMASDEIATRLSSVRALVAARDAGHPLLTLCSACHHVIKRVNRDMAENAEIRDKVNAYLGLDEPYHGEVEVVHYLEVLRDKVGFDELAKKVTNPLKGSNIGAYYGCMLLRPSAEMNFDNPENPQIMENLISALGAKSVFYPERNECCGGYLAIENPELTKRKCEAVVTSAETHGADTLITACPLCMYNLAKNSAGDKLPVKYFTELLADALGVK